MHTTLRIFLQASLFDLTGCLSIIFQQFLHCLRPAYSNSRLDLTAYVFFQLDANSVLNSKCDPASVLIYPDSIAIYSDTL